ncbi:MAG: BatD family protein [Phycisphaerae bacterium]
MRATVAGGSDQGRDVHATVMLAPALRRALVPLAACAALWVCPAALAQPSVELRVVTSEAYQGEPIDIELRIHNFTDDASVDALPDIPNCRFRVLGGGSDFQSTNIFNGRVSRNITRTFSLELTAGAPGVIEIPPIEVVVDGKRMRTAPAKIVVKPSEGAALLFSEITCDQERLYVGQQARFTLSIWVKPPRVDDRFVDERTVMQFFRGTRLAPFPGDVQTERRRRADETGTETTYYVYSAALNTTVEHEGVPEFEGVEISMTYPSRFMRDIFGEITNVSGRRLRSVPRVLAPSVQALPTAGRPANFSGAVGELSIRVSAEPTRVRVGDPITLTIDLAGDIPLETLRPPLVAAQPDLTEAFRVPSETLAGAVVGGHKRFTQVLRAKRADIREIPPIEMPYFNPKTGEYAVARSRAIPIHVTATDTLDARELEGLPAAPEKPNEPTQPVDGLAGIETRENLLLTSTAPISVAAPIVATAAPAAAFGLAWGWATLLRARSGDSTRRRRQGALRRALEQLGGLESVSPREAASGVATALTTYLADRTNAPPAHFVGGALRDALLEMRVSDTTATRCQALTDRCSGAAYGATYSDDVAALLRDARELLGRLEKELA